MIPVKPKRRGGLLNKEKNEGKEVTTLVLIYQSVGTQVKKERLKNLKNRVRKQDIACCILGLSGTALGLIEVFYLLMI